jgi:hypothetical protein
MLPGRVLEPSHDLTAVVDPEGSCVDRSHEAMSPGRVDEGSHDLTPVVDP